jgi:hypothetical protein
MLSFLFGLFAGVFSVQACMSEMEYSGATRALLKDVPMKGFYIVDDRYGWRRGVEKYRLPGSYQLDVDGNMQKRPFDRMDSRLIRWNSLDEISNGFGVGGLDHVISDLCGGDAVLVSAGDRWIVFFSESPESEIAMCLSAEHDENKHDASRAADNAGQVVKGWIPSRC